MLTIGHEPEINEDRTSLTVPREKTNLFRYGRFRRFGIVCALRKEYTRHQFAREAIVNRSIREQKTFVWRIGLLLE
jgi:hypothetical protein